MLKAVTSVDAALRCLVRVTRECRLGYMAYSHLCQVPTGVCEKAFLLALSLNNLVATNHGYDALGLIVTTYPSNVLDNNSAI